MNTRKIVIRVVLVLIGLPIVLGLLACGFFYSIFYFPNWTGATTGSIVSSGEKREYLLYVPQSYDRTKPTPLVISLTLVLWQIPLVSSFDSPASRARRKMFRGRGVLVKRIRKNSICAAQTAANHVRPVERTAWSSMLVGERWDWCFVEYPPHGKRGQE